MMPAPPTPLTAATHPDPYPYYAHLAKERPLHWDAALGLWVASGSEAVAAALRCPHGRVRPLQEPVPMGLAGSAGGELFGHLVRMTDGPRHHPAKAAVQATLDALASTRVWAMAQEAALFLSASLRPAKHREQLSAFMFQLPVHTLMRLLGVPESRREAVGQDLESFARCLAPGAPDEHLTPGRLAAERLRDAFQRLERERPPGLLVALAGNVRTSAGAGPHPMLMVANAIGLMTQSYEATAGLLGNALLALRRHRELRNLAWDEVIQATLRLDPPIQNTRRYLAEDTRLLDQSLLQGQGILIFLASAPEFAFGAGPHACPGETMASLIAGAGLEHLRQDGLDLDALSSTPAHRPSLNTRIPIFA